MEHGEREATATAVVFALSAGVLAWTTLPGPHWHDTAEFGAVAWRLGLSHPPGHPLHAVLTHGAQRLPFGDVAFRANLLSALSMGAAVALLYRLLRAVAPRTISPAEARGMWTAIRDRVPAMGAAMLPVAMPAVWLQGVRAEVYALQLLLCVAIAWLCLLVARGEDHRALPALALAFGLAGANHSLIGAALIPLAVVAIFVGKPFKRSYGYAAVGGALGLATYLYLPLRARHGGEVGWGMPTDVGSLWATISGRAWHANIARDPADVDLAGNALNIFGYGIEQIGVGAVILLSVGLAVGLATGTARRPGVALGALFAAACTFGTRFLYPFDPLNPDIGGYFSPALVAVLVATWSLTARPWRWAFLGALVWAAPNHDPGQRRDQRTAESLTRAYFDDVPPDGVLVLSDYASSFLGWYLRAAEGIRPDVMAVFRGQVGQPWARDRLATLHPERAAMLTEFPRGFDGPDARYEPGVEASRLGPLVGHLAADGVTLAPGGLDSLDRLAAAFARVDVPRDLDALRFVGFLHAQHAEHHLRRGRRHLAGWHLAHADALAPGDPWLADLRHRLGPL